MGGMYFREQKDQQEGTKDFFHNAVACWNNAAKANKKPRLFKAGGGINYRSEDSGNFLRGFPAGGMCHFRRCWSPDQQLTIVHRAYF